MSTLMQHVVIRCGDALALLRKMPAESVHCVVTSPPYWALRDYGVAGQYGLEPDPRTYIRKMVRVFREVRRVLRKDGTLWLNVGDSYSANGGQYGNEKSTLQGTRHEKVNGAKRAAKRGPGIKKKDLIGIPWALAFALRADGWYLRQDIIWHKPNGMPSSVTDRCVHQHEFVFLLTKSARYHFDNLAIQEPAKDAEDDARRIAAQHANNKSTPTAERNGLRVRRSGNKARIYGVNATNPHLGRNVPWAHSMANKRSVWSVNTTPYEEAHFAVFPSKLIEPCILAGCPRGGVVLDPFAGSGTTGGVAVAHGRKAILLELNPAYIQLMPARIEQVVRELHDIPKPPKVAPGQLAAFEQPEARSPRRAASSK